ncbi:MAG: hypothetical protein KJZ80_10505 [Hyphomicrobiaceae bacterium]|nr:hypothetical protein [Hyphomicrobiaceae bacterium]
MEMQRFIGRVVRRLEEIVEEETATLRKGAAADLRPFNARKGQGLLDLSRALRQLDGRELDPGTIEGLRALRSALEANRAVLSVHLQAVREIAGVVTEAIREAESDGTYAPPFERKGSSR